jgi:hypothetical protein
MNMNMGLPVKQRCQLRMMQVMLPAIVLIQSILLVLIRQLQQSH